MATEQKTDPVDFTDSTPLVDPDSDVSNNQGLVYLDSSGEFVWKISQGYDFIVDHEARVMESLSPLKSCCPNYVYSRGKHTVDRREIPADVYHTTEPISVPTTLLKMDHVIGENGNPAESLGDIIEASELTPKRSFAIVMQLANALWFGQRLCRFTHYDLHAGNVLIKQTPSLPSGALYISDTSVSFTPVYGEIPVIFDYGHSYTTAHDHQPFYNTVEHAQIGYLPCTDHPWADTRPISLIAGASAPMSYRAKITNTWVRWLNMFPRRGFSSYNPNGWESGVNLGVPSNLGEWLSERDCVEDSEEKDDESNLELVGDLFGVLSKFPFMHRRTPDPGAQTAVFYKIIELFQECVCCDVDTDFIGSVYAVLQAYIAKQDLLPVLRRMKRQIRDPKATEEPTKNRAKKLAGYFRELSGYVENFHHDVYQARLGVWEEKSGYIAKGYRTMESIATEARKAAPEGIGEDIKQMRQVVVYDYPRKTTRVITIPEFTETAAELTLMYRRGVITEQIQALYSAETD